jgi:hypothetical protein
MSWLAWALPLCIWGALVLVLAVAVLITVVRGRSTPPVTDAGKRVEGGKRL